MHQPHFSLFWHHNQWPFLSKSSLLPIIWPSIFCATISAKLNTISLSLFLPFFSRSPFVLLPCTFPSPGLVHPIFISHTHSYPVFLHVFHCGIVHIVLTFFFPSFSHLPPLLFLTVSPLEFHFLVLFSRLFLFFYPSQIIQSLTSTFLFFLWYNS